MERQVTLTELAMAAVPAAFVALTDVASAPVTPSTRADLLLVDQEMLDAASGASVGDDDGSDKPDEPEEPEAEQASTGERARAATSVLQEARCAIASYATSKRTSDLELPCSLSAAERRELHTLVVDTYTLFSRSVGVGEDRQLIVSHWKPLTAFTA